MAGVPWLVCHTRPRCEKKFAALLVAETIEHYLPLIPSVRRYGRKIRTSTKPLFPGYVFVQVAPDRKPRLYQLDLLVRTIAVTNEAAFLRQLADVRAILASGLDFVVLPRLRPGRSARIVGGPLHGLVGVVHDAAQPHGIVLAIDVLQKGLLVRLPASRLSPLP